MAKIGRPSKFKPEMLVQARKLALLGATDQQIADFFEVSVQSIDGWKNSNPEFLKALKGGKDELDAKVEQSLFRRAMGYEHDAVKIFAKAETGDIVQVPYVERFAPDVTACIFWLKNRQRDRWRDRQDVQVEVRDLSSAIEEGRKRAREKVEG